MTLSNCWEEFDKQQLVLYAEVVLFSYLVVLVSLTSLLSPISCPFSILICPVVCLLQTPQF